jgi:hypothetical protein
VDMDLAGTGLGRESVCAGQVGGPHRAQ